MQFIKTLFVALIPLFISIYLNRKYQLADKDRTIVEKQFEIYNLLYLNIARDTLNQPINGNLAKTNIIKLIKEIQKSTTLCNYLGPKLYEYLLFCNSNGISNSTLGNIQLQIESDLEQIKYKLGYPCKLKYKTHMFQLFVLLCTVLYLIINIYSTMKFNNNQLSQNEKMMVLYVIYGLTILLLAMLWILLNNFVFIKKYIRVTINYIKSKMEKWLQNIEQKIYTKVIEKLWFSLNVLPILSIIFQILLDTKMHYTKNKLHPSLYTSETTFSSAGLNLYCCIFSPFS